MMLFKAGIHELVNFAQGRKGNQNPKTNMKGYVMFFACIFIFFSFLVFFYRGPSCLLKKLLM